MAAPLAIDRAAIEERVRAALVASSELKEIDDEIVEKISDKAAAIIKTGLNLASIGTTVSTELAKWRAGRSAELVDVVTTITVAIISEIVSARE